MSTTGRPHTLPWLAALLPLCGPAVATDAATDLRSVRQAYAALEARPVTTSVSADGWTVFSSGSASRHVSWSFAPPGDPAHPVVIQREALIRNGVPTVTTRFVCEGPRSPCERLYARLRATGDVAIATHRPPPEKGDGGIRF